MNKFSDFNMLKVLGVIPNYFEDKQQTLKVRCPFHEDMESSLKIDYENTNNPNANTYSSSYCYVCADAKKSNTNIAKYWLQYFTERDVEDNREWMSAFSFFKNLRTNYFKDYPSYDNQTPVVTFGVERSYDYQLVKTTVLKIFPEDKLYNLNQNWESELKYLVDLKELGVERQNQAHDWALTFNVSFGKDYNIGAVRYQPGHEPKVLMAPKTPTGLFMPFYMGKEQGKTNPNHVFDSNIIANSKNTIFIVEGQKDALALRLIGIPAITITGGAKAKANEPQMFTDKNVYIIYDNDMAGREGARALGMQLMEYAKSVKIATDVYSDMKEKEDAFDFFFVYDKSKVEFQQRLVNEDNYELITKELIAQEKQKAEDYRKSEEAAKAIEEMKRKTVGNTIPFKSVFGLDPHKFVKLDARLDETKTESKHSIYLRPMLEIKDYRTLDDRQKFNIDKFYTKLEENIGLVNKFSKEMYGKEKYIVSKVVKNDLISNFTIERVIDEEDFDIIEAIILGGNADEGAAYEKAGAWKEIKGAINTFITSVGNSWTHYTKVNNIQRPEGQVFVGKRSGAAIRVITKGFNKAYTMDFTEARIYEDLSHEERVEEIGSHMKLYQIFLPSHLITGNTKIGDKVTIYGGKLKRSKDNKPYFVAWHFDYRDEIEDYELTDTTKAQLDILRFKGSTLEELKEHQDKMYHLWRYVNPKEEYVPQTWETVELTYSSPARITQVYDDPNINNSELKTALNTLIIGDSQVGKGASMNSARTNYGVGHYQEFMNSTPKGLVGGSDTAKNNAVTLGTLPLNHRGLVNLDELSALADKDYRAEFFRNILSMMQDGRISISRVSGDISVVADVRLLVTSNTISRNSTNPPMATYKASSFWKAAEQMLPIPTLNRFTIVYFPTIEDYTNMIINGEYNSKRIVDKIADKGWEPIERDVYLSKMRWIWSRKPEHIELTTEIDNYITEQTQAIIEKQLGLPDGVEIGLYSTGSTSKHITMIAAAVAASVISTDETYERIIIDKIHVDYAIQYYMGLYGESTGIPEYLDRIRNSASVGSKDVETIFGNGNILTKFYRNKVITLNDNNDLIMRAHMYELYEQLYNFLTNGDSEDGTVHIAWGHVISYFDLVRGRWNEIVANPTDPSRALYANIGNENIMNNSNDFASQWKLMMSKLGIIVEKSNNRQTFVLQPKFTTLWHQIKEEYSKIYDIETHEKKGE